MRFSTISAGSAAAAPDVDTRRDQCSTPQAMTASIRHIHAAAANVREHERGCYRDSRHSPQDDAMSANDHCGRVCTPELALHRNAKEDVWAHKRRQELQ